MIRIYDDRAYVKNSYLPKNSESGYTLYLSKSIVAGLHDLTDSQGEVIFRNVINGEDVSSIAESKKCSARNIRDIRNRALKALRATIASEAGSGSLDAVLFALWALLFGAAAYLLLVPGVAAVWRIVRLAQNSAKRQLRSIFKKKRK